MRIDPAAPVSMQQRLTPGSRGDAIKTAAGEDSIETDENAVQLGLKWLASKQDAEGTFGTQGFQVEAASLALLAFLGHGELPKKSPYAPAMVKAKDWLVSKGTEYEGYFSLERSSEGLDIRSTFSIGIVPTALPQESLDRWRTYYGPVAHALAVTALAEYDACSPDPKIEDLLKIAKGKILAAQSSDGSWNEHFAKELVGCTVTTAFQVLALQSLSLARLSDKNTESAIHSAAKFVEKLRRESNGRPPHEQITYRIYPENGLAVTGPGAYLASFGGKYVQPPDLGEVLDLTAKKNGTSNEPDDIFFSALAAMRQTQGHAMGFRALLKSIAARQLGDGAFPAFSKQSLILGYMNADGTYTSYAVQRTAQTLLILETPYLYPNRSIESSQLPLPGTRTAP